MSDSTKQGKDKQGTDEEVGMLFLFDVVNSSKTTSAEDRLKNALFYQKIDWITNNVIEEINDKHIFNIRKVQNTGDGCYFFSQTAESVLFLWTTLELLCLDENIQIRCGADYGHVRLNGINTGSHLGNIVARCCSFGDEIGGLVVTDSLYRLIKDCSFYKSIAPKVSSFDNPDLKGCTDIIRIYKLSRSKDRKTQPKLSKSKKGISFWGRETVFQECLQITLDCLSANQSLLIMGVSGVGKTTLAMSVSIQLDLSPVCIDLRQVSSLHDLHRIIIDAAFDEIKRYNLSNEATFRGKDTLITILSKLFNLVLVFDHAELLIENAQRYTEVLDLFQTLRNLHVKSIFTSTCSLHFEALNITQWTLRTPNEDEKISMLNHWIKTRRSWLQSLASGIANHSYLICLIGQQFQGTYRKKEEVAYIEQRIEGASSVSEYLAHLINQFPMGIRFWAYLAYLFNGSIYSKAIPKKSLDAFYERGLVKEIGRTAVFHPLVMKAVGSERDVLDFHKISYEMLCKIHDEECSTLIEYYKYHCLGSSAEKRKVSLTANWQTWSEEIDSYKVQALIEELKYDLLDDKDAIVFDLFSSIIHIFQGKQENLEIAARKCSCIVDDENTPLCVKLLAQIEYIECQRKIKGPAYAISLINNNLSVFNNAIAQISSDRYSYYGKYYYLGTFYFLIGNILRSMEDHEGAISAYNISKGYILKEDHAFRNSELQKVHIAYGIAESYLKNGQYQMASELAEAAIRSSHSMAKFGIALLFLLKARAFLCDEFTDDNYEAARDSIVKATELFKEIRLPNYIMRCELVQAAIYLKKRKKAAARKLLVEMDEHLPGNDDMSYRVGILLSGILGIKEEGIAEKIDVITQRKGKQIGLFYINQSNADYTIATRQQMPTIRITNGVLGKSTFSIDTENLNTRLWLVD